VIRTCICGREFTTDCNDGYCSDACEEHNAEAREARELEDLALDAHRPTVHEREEI